MRRIMLAVVPVLLFVGALVALNDSPPQSKDAPPHVAYPPAQAVAAPNTSAETNTTAPPPPAPQQPAAPPSPSKPVVYVAVSECTGGSGVVAYEWGNTTQVQPARGKSAQCSEPVALIEDGKRYFGCADGGKIILDCDWFVQTIGRENQGTSAEFGSSYVQDFSVPDVSGFSCREASIDQTRLLAPGGKICDLQTLVGNIVQGHGD
jgi:hypothetical protein